MPNKNRKINDNNKLVKEGATNFFKPVEKVRFRDFARELGLQLASSEIGFGETLGDSLATKSKDFDNAFKAQAGLDDTTLRLAKTITKNKKEGKPTERLERFYKKNAGKAFNVEEIVPSIKKSIFQIALEGAGVGLDIAAFGSLKKEKVLSPSLVKSRASDAAQQIDRILTGSFPKQSLGAKGTIVNHPASKAILDMDPKFLKSADAFGSRIKDILTKQGVKNADDILKKITTVGDFKTLEMGMADIVKSGGSLKNMPKLFENVYRKGIVGRFAPVAALGSKLTGELKDFTSTIINPVQSVKDINESVSALTTGNKITDPVQKKVAQELLNKRNQAYLVPNSPVIPGVSPEGETESAKLAKRKAINTYKWRKDVLPFIKGAKIDDFGDQLNTKNKDIRFKKGSEPTNVNVKNPSNVAGTFSPTTKDVNLFNVTLDEETTAHEMIHLLDDKNDIVRSEEKAKEFNEDWDEIKQEALMRALFQPKDKGKIEAFRDELDKIDTHLEKSYKFSDSETGLAKERFAWLGDQIGKKDNDLVIPDMLKVYYKDIFNLK